MRVITGRPLALAVAVVVSCFSVAVAEDAITASEHREPKQGEPCAAFGPGYFKLAGTETCIKIGGSVRIDVGAGDFEDGHRNNDR